jgi:hypothetical protein
MATVLWTGFDELVAQLRNLPEHLAGEAGVIVNAAADAFMADVEATYPKRTGNLARGLRKLQPAGGRFGVIYQVKNVAKHAWLFENGSQTRRSRSGNPSPMPPGHIFVPAAIRHRGRMYRNLANMLEREGLLVTGVAA